MSTVPAGHIELERAVDSIIVGRRHRQDHGDLAPLVESIRRNGLLQPITITLDGHLICGARRLAALKLLGIKTVNVWVRSGISDRLGQLLDSRNPIAVHLVQRSTDRGRDHPDQRAGPVRQLARHPRDGRFRPAQL